MLIGLPDLAKEINRKPWSIEDNQTFNIPYLFSSKGDNLQCFTNLINSKLISALVSSDKSVFLCFTVTRVISITILLHMRNCIIQ